VARKVFYSFHYVPDSWRVSTVRNAEVLEGHRPVPDNDWGESITRGGDQVIKNWITRQLEGKSCCVVLIGSQTAGRKWITYEIKQAWDAGKGVVGVHIHNLKNSQGLAVDQGCQPTQLGQRRRSVAVRCGVAEEPVGGRQGLQRQLVRQPSGLSGDHPEPRGMGGRGHRDPQALLGS
jgi:hypothetical protein